MTSCSPSKRVVAVAHTEEEYFYKLDNILLSSYQNLRNIFKSKWKSLKGEPWVNDEAHGQQLINCLNKQTKNSLKGGVGGGSQTYFDKLSSGNVEDWDITVLSKALLNIEGDPDAEKDSKLNEAIKILRDMRNSMAHHPSKKLSKGEYDLNVAKFQDSLKSLKVNELEIQKIIERAGVSSSNAAMKKVEELYKKAAKLMKGKKIERAMECYAEAIATPSLLPIHLASVFEMRAQAYLKISNGKKELISKALEDLTEALELNESSWNAHYIAGQCYRKLGNYPEAVKRLQKSLAISPVQKQVKNELDGCKVMQGVKEREDHLTKNQAPMNFKERLAHLEDETGLKMSEEEFVKMDDISGHLVKGQDHVCKAHRHYGGWGVEQNYTEAARYYGKAAKVGNAEGIYNLALCYQHGHGVTQNIQKALEYLFEAANLSPDLPGEYTRRKKNLGVAASQNSLGLNYEGGIGVVQNYEEAAKWYRKGMENGVGNSANNLGLLYSKGLGVPRDRKMAAFCWKEGVNLLDENAPVSLMGYYLQEKEPDLALGVFKIVKENKVERFTHISEEEFSMQCEMVRGLREEETPEVEEFERKNKLEVKGLTFEERRQRMVVSKSGTSGQPCGKMPKFMKRFLQGERGRQETKDKNSRLFNLASFTVTENVEEIKRRAEWGSKVAQRVLQLLQNSIRLTEFLQPAKPFFQVENAEEIIELIYNSVTLPFDELIMDSEDSLKIKQIIQSLFETKAGEKGEDDKRIRLCHAVINLKGQDDNFALELLKEGIRRYSENQFYHFYLAKVYQAMGEYPAAVKSIKEGLNIVPGDIHFLFQMGHVLSYLWKPSKTNEGHDAVPYLQKFLKRAGEDEINVPEAYFAMAHGYLNLAHQLNRDRANLIIDQAQEMFEAGLEAEKKQLPCLVALCPEKNPYAKSYKEIVSDFLQLISKGSYLESDDEEEENETSPGSTVTSIFDLKPYLRAPTRKQLVVQFRQKVFDLHEKKKKMKAEGMQMLISSKAPKFQQILPQRVSRLKPITLQEMNQTIDKIYDDRVLDLTIIENPMLGHASIHLLAEDESGDVTFLYVYNVPQDPKKVEETLGFGCKLAIMNPYVRLGQDMTVGIRNDEPRCIIYLGKIENMCRLCGAEGATQMCSRCKEAKYCSKECQEFDWKEFEHKTMCSSGPSKGGKSKGKNKSKTGGSRR